MSASVEVAASGPLPTGLSMTRGTSMAAWSPPVVVDVKATEAMLQLERLPGSALKVLTGGIQTTRGFLLVLRTLPLLPAPATLAGLRDLRASQPGALVLGFAYCRASEHSVCP